MPVTVNKYRESLIVDNRNIGRALTMTGGELGAEDTKITPYGGSPQIPIGGSKTVGNITMRFWVGELAGGYTDTFKFLGRCRGVPGKVAYASQQPLDANDNPYGSPLVYPGMVINVTPVQGDSGSSDPAGIEVELSVGEPA